MAPSSSTSEFVPHVRLAPYARRAAGAALALAFQLVAPVFAADASRILRLDPAATKITFSLGATFHTVEGDARMISGEIRFDPSSGRASGRIVIDTTSLETHDEKRDRAMHGDVLESATFPQVVFTPVRFEGVFAENGESELQLVGTLSIHGGVHEVVVPAHVSAKNGRVTGSAEFSVPYVAWGMKDPSFFMFRVKKEVKVALQIDGALANDGPGGS